MTEITFEIDDELLTKAETLAETHGTTVVEMVLSFFSDLGRSDQAPG